MDGSADGYRRRRGLLTGEDESSSFIRNARGKYRYQRRLKGLKGDHQGSDPNAAYSSAEGDSSEFSSRSTSEDVELHPIPSNDGLTDDGEAGLTKKDKRNWKRSRKRNTLLDHRIIGLGEDLKQDGKFAGKSVLRASLINALLIASWYLFSLSISIVS